MADLIRYQNRLEVHLVLQCFAHSTTNTDDLQKGEFKNRRELVDLCNKSRYVASNRFFNKPGHAKCTYSTKKPYEICRPWSNDLEKSFYLSPN